MSRTIEAASLVDLTIRDARLNDAAELAALTCELGYKTTGVEMVTRLETVLKDARYKTFVAEIGGKLCGIIGTVWHSSYLHNDLSGRIIALVVSNKMKARDRSRIGGRGGKGFPAAKNHTCDVNDAIRARRGASILR